MSKDEVLKLALEALESKYIVNCGAWRVQQDQAITAIKEALAQPEQEPAAYWHSEFLKYNASPQSFMSWQEGYEAGRQAERNRMVAYMKQMFDAYSLSSDPSQLKNRSNT